MKTLRRTYVYWATGRMNRFGNVGCKGAHSQARRMKVCLAVRSRISLSACPTKWALQLGFSFCIHSPSLFFVLFIQLFKKIRWKSTKRTICLDDHFRFFLRRKWSLLPRGEMTWLDEWGFLFVVGGGSSRPMLGSERAYCWPGRRWRADSHP
jgi:hypothetical protein